MPHLLAGRLTQHHCSLAQTYQVTERDIEDLGKIGSGITGEVFKIRHRPTQKVMAAKVSHQPAE